MFRLASALLLLLSASTSYAAEPGYYGYGSPASAEEIAGWDIDVRPDGTGLPPGSGSVEDGEWLYEDQCAECHGSFGEGVNQYPSLAGGEDTLTDNRPHKTVGSFWPHTSTLWDHIHRAMPFAQPESLHDRFPHRSIHAPVQRRYPRSFEWTTHALMWDIPHIIHRLLASPIIQ